MRVERVVPHLARRQSLSEELEVVLVFPLDLLLPPLPHPVAHVTLEAEA